MPPKTNTPKKTTKRKRAASTATTTPPRATRSKHTSQPPSKEMDVLGPSTTTTSPPRTTRSKHTSQPPPTEPAPSIPSTTTNTITPQPLQLTLPLAQKINNLILISRQIEAIWRGCFHGRRADIAPRMQQLSTHYDELRSVVEAELRTACAAAGHRSASAFLANLPIYPPSHRVKGSVSVNPRIPKMGVWDVGYSVDRELREGGWGEDGDAEDEEEEEEEERFEMVQPIGVTKGEIPLTREEERKFLGFRWAGKKGGKGKGKGVEDVSVSPCGMEVRLW